MKCLVQGILLEVNFLQELHRLGELWAQPQHFTLEDLVGFLYSFHLMDGLFETIHVFADYGVSSLIIGKIKQDITNMRGRISEGYSDTPEHADIGSILSGLCEVEGDPRDFFKALESKVYAIEN